MFTCGKCRLQGVSPAKMCKTVQAVRAHYAGGERPAKRTRKAQPKG
jgi:hypothetical protein